MSVSSFELRKKFLSFFASKGHKIVPSAPLLPKDDPTLLFVNAGMVPFKDIFTGKEKSSFDKATSSQKCVRAGGKHNDLENVGRTARHHTFFEMLGNFSFGDYFKEAACLYAWEFLTKDLGLDPKKISVTVFGGEGNLPADTEAETIWRDVIGLPKNAISRRGSADNFWSMGDTGPCGPCTEIHYNRGEITANFGDDDKESDQVMEVWNIVFMQYEKKADGSLIPLPAPSVDTGMGLERLATVINELSSNYETDLLNPLVLAAAKLAKKTYKKSNSEDDVSLRVIADHSRTTAFLLADGVLPGNEGRGYVLRRIMRRAIRHGARLGLNKPFFHNICSQVTEIYKDIYPELKLANDFIIKVVEQEEELFRRTLERGLDLFEKATEKLKKGDKLDGATVFNLYETYGFPPDLTTTLAEEKQFEIDWASFEKAKQNHITASSSKELGFTGVDDIYKKIKDQHGATKFTGYESSNDAGKVIAIIKNGKLENQLSENELGMLIFDQSPFYGESGGQIGDTGTIESKNTRATVTDTKKIIDLNVHLVKVEIGIIKLNEILQLKIDKNRRENIKKHHSVTHLMHSALRKVLGDHVIQKGSLVAPDRMRFDYSHFESMTKDQISEVENLVNKWILANKKANAKVMNIEQAKSKGAMALFGEKYGEDVRVVQMGPNSTELCGGTHVKQTGDIGLFRIVSEGPLASSIRRIEAVAGKAALAYTQKEHEQLQHLTQLLNVPSHELESRVQSIIETLSNAQKELAKYKSKDALSKASDALTKSEEINGVKVITERVENMDLKVMQDYADKLRDVLQSGIVVLGTTVNADKCHILVAVTKDLTGKYHAGKIVSALAETIGGKGGGRPDFAQAGGNKPQELERAFAKINELI